MDDSGVGNLQNHSTSVLRHPAVVAALITVLGGVVVALISLAKSEPQPVVLVGPNTTGNTPTRLVVPPDAPSVPTDPQDGPVVEVPDQAVGRWRGAIGLSGYEMPADLTVARVPVGESVGVFQTQLAGDLGSCTYRAQLMSAECRRDIVLNTSKTKGGAFCAGVGAGSARLRRLGSGPVAADGLPGHDASTVRSAALERLAAPARPRQSGAPRLGYLFATARLPDGCRPAPQSGGRARPRPHALLDVALEEARAGLAEGGIPIGAALFAADGTLLGRGHNRRVQDGDPSMHAETAAFRAAGRQRDYRKNDHGDDAVAVLVLQRAGAAVRHRRAW